MCFHNMERKELQALCKKHKIPANLSNLEMANRLKEHFKEKEKSPIQGSIYGQDDEIASETDSTNMVMDFHSMKRRELQALCQKHKIPANLPNLEMVKRLTESFKEKEKSPLQGPIKGSDKIVSETDSKNMVMDFHSMKRKELQALCQKHDIPANLSNLEMEKRLTEFFKENEKPSIQGLINEQDENVSETESADLAMTRKVKKVRFSPEHEMFEFTRSPELKRSRRNSVSVRPSNLSVEAVDNGLTDSGNVDGQGRVTRSRGTKLTEEHVNETKRGKKVIKVDEQKKNVSTIEKSDNDGVPVRELRSKGKILAADDVKNVAKRGKAKIENENALDDVDDEKSAEEIVMKTKRLRRAVEIVDNVPLLSGEADDNRVVTRRSSRNKGVPEKNEVAEVHRAIEPQIMKRVPEKNEATEVHLAIEPQIMVRRSKRNASTVGDSQVLNDDTRTCENDGVKGSRKSAKLLTVDDANGETDGCVLPIEEPVKLEVRRSDRRKSVIALPEKGRNGELKAETENMRSSVPKLVIAGGVSKIGKKVPQPITRRSRRKTTILEPVASRKKLNTDVAVQNCEAEKCMSPRRSRRVASVCKSLENEDELGGDTIIQHKNEPRKRKRGPISEGDVLTTDDVRSSSKQSMEESRNVKSVSIVEPQLSESERAESISDTDTRNKNVTSNVGLGESSRKTFREEQDVFIAESAEMNFIDRDEFVNSVENATSKFAEFETDFANSEKRISASNIKDARNVDSLEFDVQDIVEQDITNMDKNQSEAQFLSPIKDSSHIDTIDNQILEEGSNVSGNEGFAESSSAADSVLPADLVDHVGEVEGVSVQENLDSIEIGEANMISSAIACHHNDVDQMEASNGISEDNTEHESNVKTFREEQDVSIAERAETNFIDRDEFMNSVENAPSRIAELEMDFASSEKRISASSINHARKVDSLELDVQDMVKQDITNMDKNQSEAQLFSPIEDSSHIGTIDNQILEEGRNEGFAEPSSAADSVLPVDLVGHVGEVEWVSVQENLDSIEIGEANAISSAIACHHNDVDHIEASNGNSEDNKEHAGEVGAPESCADLEVPEAEADTGAQPDTNVADHVGEVEAMEAPNSSFDDNKEDGTSEAGEVGTPKSCERCFEYTDSKSALQLKERSSGKPRSIEGDNAEIENGGCLKEHKTASDEDDEFGVADLFAGERSVGVSSQDRGIVSGEYSAMISDEQLMDNEYVAVFPKTTYPNMTNICPERDPEAEQTGEREKSFIDKSIYPEVAKTDEGGSSDCHENREFTMTNILDVERKDEIVQQDGEILFGENSAEGFDEEGVEIKLKSGCEAYQISEGDEAENNDNHENSKDEGREFSVFNLFDGEKSDRVTLQDRGIFSAEDSIKDFNEQVVFDDFPAVSTMCDEVKIGECNSSLNEISPSKPHISSKSPGTEPIISDACEIIDDESGSATIPEKEVAIVQNNTSDGDHAILNQADEQTNEYTPIRAELQKSPSDITTAVTSNLGASESETTGLAMCMSQTCGKEITSPVVEGFHANEDGNDGNCGQDVDMSMDCTVSKSGAESLCELECHHSEDTVYHQSLNLHEKYTLTDVGEKPNDVESSHSLTEIELSNILEATVNDVTPTGLNDTMNKSDVTGSNTVTNKKGKEMEGEGGNESAKATYENAFLPTNKKVSDSDSDSGPGVDREDYQLKLLFATPIKIDSSSKVDETSSHENELNSADEPLTECVGTAVEYSAAHNKSDEMVRDAEYEFENCLCPSSNTGEKINYEESNEVENVESMNSSGLGLSEASVEHLTVNTCDEDGLKKSDFITEENKEEVIISLGESCLFEEAADNECGLTMENTISSSGSLRNLDKVEGCQDMLMVTDLSENLSCGNRVCPKSERKMALSSGAEFEILDADIQKSNALENCHHLTGCSEDNNVSKTLMDTLVGSMDAEGAGFGSFNSEKDVTGTSPSLFPNDDEDLVTERKEETGDYIDPYEAEKWDEKDDDSRPLPDNSDEPHCNSEVAILKSPSAGNTLELQSTNEDTIPIAQNLNSVLPAAEQGFSVCGAEFDGSRNLAMHILPGDTENGDSEKSETGTPDYNSEGGREKKNEGVEKKSTATKVQLSISELNLERDVSDGVTANENHDIEKLDVGTPLLNLEGDHEKNDEDVEENSIATVVRFPISEFHLEEKILDSSTDVLPSAAFGCNEFLKECEVDDTINEYMESELAFMNEVTVCEDGTESEKFEETIPVNLHAGGYTAADKSPVETESEEKIEEMLFKESVTGNSGSAGNDAFLLQKAENESVEGHISSSSSSRQLCSSVKDNARTILIHGTPSKAVTMVDMKENGPAYKSSNIGDFTAARPAKRKALQDVKWK